MMSVGVTLWWSFLCTVAAVNIVAWALAAATLNRRAGLMSADLQAARRMQLLLSAIYVAGCAFRSVLPVYDVPRICLFDTWASSVIVGRSVASIAELCFVAQWALLLRESSRATGSVFGGFVSLVLVPLIAIAETCSWYSVLTTSNLGHVAEESIWGLSATLFVAGVAMILPRCPVRRQRVLLAWCVAGIAYAAYMFLVDVPMYWSRWIADESAGRYYMTISQGLFDVAHRRVVSYHWQDWRHEILWMSLYFSVGVWISISLIRAPAPAGTRAGNRRRLPAAALGSSAAPARRA